MTFIETFTAVFLAQSTVLFIGWIFRKGIEPRLDKGHSLLSKTFRRLMRYLRKKMG